MPNVNALCHYDRRGRKIITRPSCLNNACGNNAAMNKDWDCVTDTQITCMHLANGVYLKQRTRISRDRQSQDPLRVWVLKDPTMTSFHQPHDLIL